MGTILIDYRFLVRLQDYCESYGEKKLPPNATLHEPENIALYEPNGLSLLQPSNLTVKFLRHRGPCDLMVFNTLPDVHRNCVMHAVLAYSPEHVHMVRSLGTDLALAFAAPHKILYVHPNVETPKWPGPTLALPLWITRKEASLGQVEEQLRQYRDAVQDFVQCLRRVEGSPATCGREA